MFCFSFYLYAVWCNGVCTQHIGRGTARYCTLLGAIKNSFYGWSLFNFLCETLGGSASVDVYFVVWRTWKTVAAQNRHSTIFIWLSLIPSFIGVLHFYVAGTSGSFYGLPSDTLARRSWTAVDTLGNWKLIACVANRLDTIITRCFRKFVPVCASTRYVWPLCSIKLSQIQTH